MLEPISSVIPKIIIREGHAVTTSIAVASFFGKLHKNVLQKIRTLECSPAFMTANFSAVVATAQAGFDEREIEAYEITKNGFVFLVMGFTGKKAALFKEAYIAEFDRMEAELQQQHAPLFPLNADLFVRIKNGKTIHVQQAQEGEHFMSFPTFKEVAERAGYLVVHCDDLKAMTIDNILRLGESAGRALNLSERRHIA